MARSRCLSRAMGRLVCPASFPSAGHVCGNAHRPLLRAGDYRLVGILQPRAVARKNRAVLAHGGGRDPDETNCASFNSRWDDGHDVAYLLDSDP